VIVSMGDWVLSEACRQLVQWRQAYGHDLRLWVNVSAQQLTRAGFVESFLATLQSTGLPPAQLGVDIAESTFAQLDTARELALATLVRAGVKLAVDEFGLGGSSLRTLRKLPLTQFKLDRRIVDGVLDPEGDALELIPLAVKLAGTLGAAVVAVGVEGRDQLERLRSLQCDAFEGTIAGAPMTPEELETVLQTGTVSVGG
jgi:EAL domain-containing protein (putative c-di-GMP-specific phosphodiesterase class I)